MRIFECPVHDQDFDHPDCNDCTRIKAKMKENEEVAKRSPRYKHTRMSVYWSHNDDALAKGRVIENLAHRPVHFQNKDQFRDYLKRHNIREKA